MADDLLLVDVDDQGVAVVTLNRPERRNALTFPMLAAFLDAMWALDADEGVRAIVATGAGDAFCSGLDLSQADRDGIRFGPDAGEPIGPAVSERIGFWRMRTPVIMAINGAAIGAGLTIPLQADVRYVAADAKLRFPFTRLNLIPEASSTWTLPRLVGVSNALELLLSARWFSGEEAAAMGMASAALPREEVLPAALALAREIATYCAPVAVGLTKQLVHRAIEEPSRQKVGLVETGLTTWAATLADTGPAIAALIGRTRPSFTGSKHERPPAEFDPLIALGDEIDDGAPPRPT